MTTESPVRNLTAAMVAETRKTSIAPVSLVSMEFTSGTLRLWTGPGTLVWNRESFIGAGGLAGISAIRETTDTSPTGFSLSLNGVDPIYIALILTAFTPGGAVNIWQGLLTETGALVSDPTLVARGTMDVPTIEDSGTSCTITVTVENALLRLKRPLNRRNTSQDQQQDHPGDRGFDYVPLIQDKALILGSPLAHA